MTEIEQSKLYLTVKVTDLYLWQKVICRMQKHSDRVERVGYYYEQGLPWIYRGQSFERWAIKSSLERSIGRKRWDNESLDSIKRVEDASLQYFKQHARLIGIDKCLDDVEWLCYMQHYGCPTRLVDLTTVPLVALYHAIYGLDAKLDFSIYAISRNHILGVEYRKGPYQDEPEKITNQTVDVGYDIQNARRIANWLINPRGNKKPEDDTEAPIICVLPEFENKRIESQSGIFLLQRELDGSFEEDLVKMMGITDQKEMTLEEFDRAIAKEDFYNSIRQIKFVFGRELRAAAKILLRTSGITHRTMFPDFHGLAKDAHERFFVRDEGEMIVERKLFRPKLNLLQHLPEIEESANT